MGKRYNRKYSYVNDQRIVKIQRTIDLLAYGSLFLDVCIALLTSLSLANIRTGEQLMVPIHYTLTAVVLMSLTSIGMLLYLKHYERIMAEFLRMKCRIKMPLTSPRMRYSLRWTLRDKKKKFRRFFGID